MAAYAISNAVDSHHREEREAAYMRTIERYKPEAQKMFPEMFSEIVMSLEENPDQDCLGDIYMRLELNNSNHGQYFTPYHVCHLMSEVTSGDIKKEIEERGWISVCDPCVGAGAMFVAHANTCIKQGANHQMHVLYVGQDIDPIVAKMAYIQLSLLGCAGYICIGNSLTEPLTGHCLFPDMERDIYITPMFYSDAWEGRRQWAIVEHLIGKEMPTQDHDEAERVPPEGNKAALATDAEPYLDSYVIETVPVCEQMSLF